MKPVFPPSVDMMLHEWLWRKRSRACDRLPQTIPFLASTSRVQPCGPWKLNYDEALGERKDERQQGNSQATRSFAKHKGLNDCMDWHQRLHNKASAVPSVNLQLQAPWSSAPPRHLHRGRSASVFMHSNAFRRRWHANQFFKHVHSTCSVQQRAVDVDVDVDRAGTEVAETAKGTAGSPLSSSSFRALASMISAALRSNFERDRGCCIALFAELQQPSQGSRSDVELEGILPEALKTATCVTSSRITAKVVKRTQVLPGGMKWKRYRSEAQLICGCGSRARERLRSPFVDWLCWEPHPASVFVRKACAERKVLCIVDRTGEKHGRQRRRDQTLPELVCARSSGCWKRASEQTARLVMESRTKSVLVLALSSQSDGSHLPQCDIF